MPEVILETDTEESGNDNNGTVDEEDYEQCGPDQSLLQQESESSQNGYTLFKSIYHYMPYIHNTPDVSEEDEQNEPHQQTLQQQECSLWTLLPCPR
jgi:hypothetical protein